MKEARPKELITECSTASIDFLLRSVVMLLCHYTECYGTQTRTFVWPGIKRMSNEGNQEVLGEKGLWGVGMPRGCAGANYPEVSDIEVLVGKLQLAKQ
jgi:hypothetical protein